MWEKEQSTAGQVKQHNFLCSVSWWLSLKPSLHLGHNNIPPSSEACCCWWREWCDLLADIFSHTLQNRPTTLELFCSLQLSALISSDTSLISLFCWRTNWKWPSTPDRRISQAVLPSLGKYCNTLSSPINSTPLSCWSPWVADIRSYSELETCSQLLRLPTVCNKGYL